MLDIIHAGRQSDVCMTQAASVEFLTQGRTSHRVTDAIYLRLDEIVCQNCRICLTGKTIEQDCTKFGALVLERLLNVVLH